MKFNLELRNHRNPSRFSQRGLRAFDLIASCSRLENVFWPLVATCTCATCKAEGWTKKTSVEAAGRSSGHCHTSNLSQKITHIPIWSPQKLWEKTFEFFCFSIRFENSIHMTQSRLMSWYESCRWVKVKVVKWCRKKWNEHNLMYICHQQCEIMHKFQRNSSNGQFDCFHYVR